MFKFFKKNKSEKEPKDLEEVLAYMKELENNISVLSKDLQKNCKTTINRQFITNYNTTTIITYPHTPYNYITNQITAFCYTPFKSFIRLLIYNE